MCNGFAEIISIENKIRGKNIAIWVIYYKSKKRTFSKGILYKEPTYEGKTFIELVLIKKHEIFGLQIRMPAPFISNFFFASVLLSGAEICG